MGENIDLVLKEHKSDFRTELSLPLIVRINSSATLSPSGTSYTSGTSGTSHPHSFREKVKLIDFNPCADSSGALGAFGPSGASASSNPSGPSGTSGTSQPHSFCIRFKNCPLSTHLTMKEPYWPYSFLEKNENECAGTSRAGIKPVSAVPALRNAGMPPRRSRSIPEVERRGSTLPCHVSWRFLSG